jgi:hypothetical protein
MKATELRLGNLYDHYGTPKQVTPSVIEDLWEAPRVWVKPIPITSEWLARLGFVMFNGGIIESYSIDVTGITMAKSETLSLATNNDKEGYWYVYFRQGDSPEKELFHTNDLVLLQRKMQYVHQLQNLYFALTGEELTIIS